MNKEEVDKFCKEYYGFTLEDADGSIGYWMGKYQELEQENKELKERINTYENPEDLTLMFMYCEEKAKDKIKELHNKIDKAIRYINKHRADGGYLDIREVKELLKILKDSDVDDN